MERRVLVTARKLSELGVDSPKSLDAPDEITEIPRLLTQEAMDPGRQTRTWWTLAQADSSCESPCRQGTDSGAPPDAVR
jgi:hypothetical protein